jgi:hypothetical protein
MLLVFSCTNCGKQFEKDASFAGKKARCSQCGEVFTIPTPARGTPSRGLRTFDEENATPVPGEARRGPRPDPPRRQSRPVPLPQAPAASHGDGDDDPYGLADDPYGLNDVPPAAKPAAGVFADDALYDEAPVLPSRRGVASPGRKKKKKRRRSSSGNEGLDFFDGLPGFLYLMILGALVVGFVAALASRTTGIYVFLFAWGASFLVLFLYGAAGIVIQPFRESFVQGIACWFCPFYMFYYACTRWDTMRGSFLSYLSSIGIVIGVALFLPAIVAFHHGFDGAVARNAMAGQAIERRQGGMGDPQPVGNPVVAENPQQGGNPQLASNATPGHRPFGPPMAGFPGGGNPMPNVQPPTIQPPTIQPPTIQPPTFQLPTIPAPPVMGPRGMGPGRMGPGLQRPRMLGGRMGPRGMGPRGMGGASEPRMPSMATNMIVVNVSGLSDKQAGRNFGDRLTELVRSKANGGYPINGSGGGGRSTYSITLNKALSAGDLAEQITWARVVRVVGNIIEVDAAPGEGG